jgi:hypothetical protein
MCNDCTSNEPRPAAAVFEPYKSPAGAGIFMNQDMAERQIEPDSLVELESVTEEGDVRRTMAVSTHPSEMLTLRQIAGRLVSF